MGKPCESCGMTRWESRQVEGWVDAMREENERLRFAGRALLDVLHRYDNFPVSAVNAMDSLADVLEGDQ